MTLLCNIGWHKWRPTEKVGFISYPVPIEKCDRCGLYLKWASPDTRIIYSENQKDDL